MERKIKVLDIEISRPLKDVVDLAGYWKLKALVRIQGSPVGYIDVPVLNGRCSASSLLAAIRNQHADAILKAAVRNRLKARQPSTENASPQTVPEWPAPARSEHSPNVTVAVCTRDRTTQLVDCLASVSRLTYDNLEVLVIDNAPSSDETRMAVEGSFPGFRYVREPRPGLDWARNRAIVEANGDILAYTDDDCIVDPAWARVLAEMFRDNPKVMAITGLVAPHELDTEAQILFEQYGGFGRGFRRQWFHLGEPRPAAPPLHLGAGRFGTGANMAYRRDIFRLIGGFDPALDVGTPTNGGGDLEMFFRILEEGYTLVYEPDAIIWHRHRRSIEELRTQLTNHGIGLYSYLVRSATAYPGLRWQILRFGWWWLWHWNLRRLFKSFVTRPQIPRPLIAAELKGSLVGLTRYPKSRRSQEAIERRFADIGSPPSQAGEGPLAMGARNRGHA